MSMSLLTQEGRLRHTFRYIWLAGGLLSVLLALGVGYLTFRYHTWPQMTLLQKLYWPSLRYTALWSWTPLQRPAHYTILAYIKTDPPTKKPTIYPCLDDQVFLFTDDQGNAGVRQGKPDIRLKKEYAQGVVFSWQTIERTEQEMYSWLSATFYGNRELTDFFLPSLYSGGLFFLLGLVGTATWQKKQEQRQLKGKHLRGTRELTPQAYQRAWREADGVGLHVWSWTPLRRWQKCLNWLNKSDSAGAAILRIPRPTENEGILLLGDPGTGKSQIMHQMMEQIRSRQPAQGGIFWDPACEFLPAHGRRGDVVLNPYDSRFPNWSPAAEIRSQADLDLVTESFFPPRKNRSENTEFFTASARAIFALMLARRPDTPTLVNWLGDQEFIDELVASNEIAHSINRKAAAQRSAVLATLARVGALLRLLPPPTPGAPVFSFTEWARTRQGWLFLTSRNDVREALLPLQAAFLNIALRRLLSVAPERGQQQPCWVLVDEVHALKTLPVLPMFVFESRKYGVRYLLGTQGKDQLEEWYGQQAKTMLAAPRLKIYLRCNEASGAQWVSDNLGEEEVEKLKVSANSNLDQYNKNSLTYSTVIEQRRVATKEQIMGLPSFHGYWKYGDQVVPFRAGLIRWPALVKGFAPRPEVPLLEPAAARMMPDRAEPALPSETALPQPRAKMPQPPADDDIDLNF